MSDFYSDFEEDEDSFGMSLYNPQVGEGAHIGPFNKEDDFKAAVDSFSGITPDELDFTNPGLEANLEVPDPTPSVYDAPVSELDSNIGSQYSSRQALLDSAQDKLGAARQGSLESIQEARDLLRSGGNVWGSLLTTIIPTALGAAFGGKDGAMLGAQAGFEGAQAGNVLGQKIDEKEANLALREADIYRQEERDTRRFIQDQQARETSKQDQFQLQDRYDARADKQFSQRKELQDDAQAFRREELGATRPSRSGGSVSSRSRGGEPDWFSKIPAGDKSKLTSAEGTIKSLAGIAGRLKEMKISTPEYQASKWVSGTDSYTLMSELRLQLGKIARLGGDVGNIAEQEQQRIVDALEGNITSSPQETAARVAALVKRVQMEVQSTLGSYKTGVVSGGDALIDRIGSIDPTTGETGYESSPTSGLSDGPSGRKFSDPAKQARYEKYLQEKARRGR